MSVRVLVVDDSATARLALRIALEGEKDVEVVGEAHDEPSTFDALRRLSPDLVTLDVYLGRDNGVRIAARIMREAARPILVVTAASPGDPKVVYAALEAGALDVVPKLPAPTHPSYEERRRRLARLVRTLASVPVVHRRGLRTSSVATIPTAATQVVGLRRATSAASSSPKERSEELRLLVLGASTGGPPVVARLLASLEAPSRYPIALVQHIMPGFTESLASWLSDTTGHRVRVVDGTTRLEPGFVYVPTDERHLVIASRNFVEASDAPARGHQRPAIDILFEGAAQHFGPRAMGVLMTGMGSDGAAGLAVLRRAGAVTVAQSPESCAVDSMPRSAIAFGAASHICPPEDFPEVIRAELQSSDSRDETR